MRVNAVDIRELLVVPRVVIRLWEPADGFDSGAGDGERFSIAINSSVLDRVDCQAGELDGVGVVQCDRLWLECGAALCDCCTEHWQNWMRAHVMGVRLGCPVSDRIRITCKSSGAHLVRRAARQYVRLYVDGRGSDECVEAVEQRDVWIHERHDSRIRHGCLQLGLAAGHYSL